MFDPYLFFGGNCRAAFTRYQEIFGGELQIVTAADMEAAGEPPMEGSSSDTVMHAAVILEGGRMLMGSDDPTNPDFGPVQGMQVCYSAKDVADANRVYDALSKGGQAIQEIIPVSFSPAFGMCIDEFGTPWMVVAEQAEGA
jgi:PhnB protein